MNFVMFPLALAPIAETIVQHWDPPMVLVGKLAGHCGARAAERLLRRGRVCARQNSYQPSQDHGRQRQQASCFTASDQGQSECLPFCVSGRHNHGQPRPWLVGRTFPRANASAVFRFGRNRISRGDQIDFVRTGFLGHHVFAHRGGRTSTKDSRRSAKQCLLRCS